MNDGTRLLRDRTSQLTKGSKPASLVADLLADPAVDATIRDNAALKWAAWYGHAGLVSTLLDWEGPDGKRVDPRAEGSIAIVYAAKQGHMDVVRALLEVADAGAADNVVFQKACSHGALDIVQRLLELARQPGSSVDPTAQDNQALENAVMKPHMDVVRALLAWVGPEGQVVNPNCRFVMPWACARGLDLVRLLLAHPLPDGGWVDARGRDNLSVAWAAKDGSLELVRFMLEWRGPGGEWADPSANGSESIQFAAECNTDTRVVEELLAWRGPQGQWVDPTWDNCAALDFAAQWGCQGMVLTLLRWRDAPQEAFDALLARARLWAAEGTPWGREQCAAALAELEGAAPQGGPVGP